MHVNFLGFAIPLFVGFILLEYAITRKRGLPYFNLHNSIANVSVGIAERLTDVFFAGLVFYVYDDVQKKYGLFHIRPGVLLWILLFLFTDFIWYWYHRLAHEINILWLVHEVHHQSEDFNLTVSARITIFQALVRTGFWLVLPLIGFPATMVTSMLLIHGVYPFFIHTRIIGKLGILEYLLVTPSHHRVHHASNPQYLDKNYGDVLIIWDKLFGTFKKEEGEVPVYGLTKPLNTYSFLWQHFHLFFELCLAIKGRPGFKQKIKFIFGRPATVDPSLRTNAEKIFHIHHNPAEIDRPLNRYVVWQMTLLLILLTGFILFENYLPVSFKAGFGFAVILTLINCGAIMEQKKWIFYIEVTRILLLLLLPFCLPHYLSAKLFIFSCTIAVILLFYRSLQYKYFWHVYKYQY